MWLKIKIWTKVTLASLLAIYTILFVYNNSNPVKFWWWLGREHETSVYKLSLGTFAAGAIAWIILRTTFKTIGQVREVRRRGKQQRMERDLADIKSKAAMLQTRPAAVAERPPTSMDAELRP